MYWNSAADFLAMGGYGLYVWGAYAVTALLVGTELAILVRRGRTLLRPAGRSPSPKAHAQ